MLQNRRCGLMLACLAKLVNKIARKPGFYRVRGGGRKDIDKSLTIDLADTLNRGSHVAAHG